MKSIARKTTARTTESLDRPIKLRPVADDERPSLDFESQICAVYMRQRGRGLSSVLKTAAGDLLVLVSAIEQDPNTNLSGTHTRQLLEIYEVLEACAVEAARAKAGAQ